MKFAFSGLVSFVMAIAIAAPIAHPAAAPDAEANAVASPNAEAEADAWRWRTLIKGQAIYKREADGDQEEPIAYVYAFENETSTDPIALYPVYVSDIEDEVSKHFNLTSLTLSKRDAEADAWRWRTLIKGQAIYKREAEADADANAEADADAWRWRTLIKGQAIY